MPTKTPTDRIQTAFAQAKQENRAALVPFITAGDPDIGTSAGLLPALAEAGADIIELGIPFSDPIADGPIIQAASFRALQQGVQLPAILEQVSAFRSGGDDRTGIVLFTYYNPVLAYGVEAFARDAAAAGADAALIVDLTWEEAGGVRDVLGRHGLHLIPLLAPTTAEQRLGEIAKSASGFLYYVSMTGVTGTKLTAFGDVERRVDHLRQVANLPVAVGFGVQTPEDARRVASFADAVVVGSELVRRIHEAGTGGAVAAASQLVSALRQALESFPTK